MNKEISSGENSRGGVEKEELSPKEIAEKRLAWVIFDSIKSKLMAVYKSGGNFDATSDIYKFLEEGSLEENKKTKEDVIQYLRDGVDAYTGQGSDLRRILHTKIDEFYPERD